MPEPVRALSRVAGAATLRRMKFHRLLLLLASLAPAVAQDDAGQAAAGAVADPVQIYIIGASVSAGFEDGPLFGAEKVGDSVPLQTVFRAWADDAGKVSMYPAMAMMAMFTDPLKIGANQVAMVKKRGPDVVLAVDFLFWFAYGYVSGDEVHDRPARLAQGLQMLIDLDLPVLIGDLPDMTGAAQRMLNPRQIPSPKVLAALNAQIAAAVAKHTQLKLVPLAPFVAAMRGEGLKLPLAAGPLATPPGALQQADRLHATRLGVAYLCREIQAALQQQMPQEHALRTRNWSFERFVEAAGAEGELEALQEAAKAGVKAEASKQAGEQTGKQTGEEAKRDDLLCREAR